MILPVFGTAAVKKTATLRLVLDTVRDALVAHAEGRTSVPPPLHMDFPETDRDCHVKAGWITGATDFTVKIATGFYRNPALGLPANHGLVCVVSARTGQVRALLDDRGLLTAWVPPPRARSSPMPWPGPARRRHPGRLRHRRTGPPPGDLAGQTPPGQRGARPRPQPAQSRRPVQRPQSARPACPADFGTTGGHRRPRHIVDGTGSVTRPAVRRGGGRPESRRSSPRRRGRRTTPAGRR